LSLPLEHYYSLVNETRDRMEGLATSYGFGHVGDGNLHLNVVMDGHDDQEKAKSIVEHMEPWIYEKVQKYNGSISAEHGIGQMKPSKLHYSRDKAMIGVMKSIKHALDPNGIMNPYKIFTG